MTCTRSLFVSLRILSVTRNVISSFSRSEIQSLEKLNLRCYSYVGVVPKDDTKISKINKAMREYLKKADLHKRFMEDEKKAFQLGKKHLANIMGVDENSLTQEKIDEAIEYLMPSGLYRKEARPMMKEPHLIHMAQKQAEFDETGRPNHFLFYTCKPMYSQLLHDCAKSFEKINHHYLQLRFQRKEIPNNKMFLEGSRWLNKAELEAVLLEKLWDSEYDSAIQTLQRLADHPCAEVVEEYLTRYRKNLMELSTVIPVLEPVKTEDGKLSVTLERCGRKSCRGSVTVIKPGDGKIQINGKGLDFFKELQPREQRKDYSWKLTFSMYEIKNP